MRSDAVGMTTGLELFGLFREEVAVQETKGREKIQDLRFEIGYELINRRDVWESGQKHGNAWEVHVVLIKADFKASCKASRLSRGCAAAVVCYVQDNEADDNQVGTHPAVRRLSVMTARRGGVATPLLAGYGVQFPWHHHLEGQPLGS